MRKIFLVLALSIFFIDGTAIAQERTVPMLRQGVKELGIEAGTIDLEGEQGAIDVDLAARGGYFLDRNLEAGVFFSWNRSRGGDDNRYGIGVFGEYHLFSASWVGFAETVPYFGADLGFGFLDTDQGEDQNSVIFVPRVGVKWYFRDYVAVDTNFFLALASDDLYRNDNELESYDYGFKIGLRVYFE